MSGRYPFLKQPIWGESEELSKMEATRDAVLRVARRETYSQVALETWMTWEANWSLLAIRLSLDFAL